MVDELASGNNAERTRQTADRLHSAAIHLLRRLRREDVASGLTAARLSALSVIVFRGPLTLGALAAAEQVQPPTMTRIANALEAAGLVAKEANPLDGRAPLLRATPLGAQLLAEGRDRRVSVLAAQLDTLPADDLALLHRAAELLDRLSQEPANRATTGAKLSANTSGRMK